MLVKLINLKMNYERKNEESAGLYTGSAIYYHTTILKEVRHYSYTFFFLLYF